MTRIWERLFIGGLADAEELGDGNPHGTTTVISLSEIPAETKRKGTNYLHIPIVDDEPVTVQQFDAIVDPLFENLRWGAVLLHCDEGAGRAPSLAAAYMDAVGYKSIDAALKETQKHRPSVHPWSVVVESLKEHLR